MKIPKGQGVVGVPMKFPRDVATAATSKDWKTEVLVCETSADYSRIVSLLASLVRPFAVAVLTPRG